MMRNKFRKKTLELCLILLVFLINIKISHAFTLGFPEMNPGGGGTTGETIEFGDWIGHEIGEHKYQYRYKSILNSNTDIAINAYDLKGNSIIPYNGHPDHRFKAGTWIGINVTEIKTASWALLDVEVQEIKKKYKCTYTKPGARICAESNTIWTSAADCTRKNGSFSYAGGYGVCTYCVRYGNASASTKTYETEPKDYNESYQCPSSHPSDSSYTSPTIEEEEVTETVADASITGGVENKIINQLHSSAQSSVANSSGQVRYRQDPNDINNVQRTILQAKSSYYKDNFSGRSGSLRKDFDFFPKYVCIDIKTSKISYQENECNYTEGKMELKKREVYESSLRKNISYWHYFIPLNAYSNSIVAIDVIKNENEIYNINQCVNFMKSFTTDPNKKNDNYRYYIAPIDDTKVFIGDYNEMGERSEDWKILTKGNETGCQISTSVEFQIEQKFYNEVNNTQSFKGFNFYYRPIDVNNPFPNGITDTSLWKNVTTELTGPSLNKEDTTYIAYISDTSEIRNYSTQVTNGKENTYTSWENMHIDGKSDFVQNSGFVQRNPNIKDFYKLGCGPANENKTNGDGTTNYLYQSECGTP